MTYPVTPEWQRRVLAELSERGARARLAREIGCSTATMTTLLQPGARHSHLVPRIHKALGWPPPAPPMAATTPIDRGADELGQIYEQLTDEARAAILAMARALAPRGSKR